MKKKLRKITAIVSKVFLYNNECSGSGSNGKCGGSPNTVCPVIPVNVPCS